MVIKMHLLFENMLFCYFYAKIILINFTEKMSPYFQVVIKPLKEDLETKTITPLRAFLGSQIGRD